jgi:VanZ family protein
VEATGIFRITHQPLRFFTLWRAIGWLIVAAIVYGSLTPRPINFPVTEGDKLGHMMAYGVLMGWFMQLYTRKAHVLLAVLCVGLGVAMEYAQLASGYRDFEYLDMAADATGVVIAWLLGGTAALAGILSWLERRLVTRQ